MKDFSKAIKIPFNIIARGEVSGHSHIAVGDVQAYQLGQTIYLDVKGEAVIKHLLEEAFVNEGREEWTGEHKDIQLAPGIYKYVPQEEFNPTTKKFKRVID